MLFNKFNALNALTNIICLVLKLFNYKQAVGIVVN